MQRPLAAVTVDSVSVSYQRAPHAVVEASLDVAAGTTMALLGPSGCGKTSLLRAVAGLETPTAGSIGIGGRTVSDRSVWVRPERRNIGMVFQDGALFPHLTVADNIAFGLRSAARSSGAAPTGSAAEQRRRRVEELLHLVELTGLADRLPETLSGGQQQRVALARSLAPNPSVLLLDEPFSALDTGLRTQVRAKVAQILREVGVTSIFVTHDQDEAFVLGDRVAVMRDGRIEQVGTPDELYRSPRTPWVAGFVGEANLVHGAPVGDGLHVDTALGRIPVAGNPVEGGAATVDVLVRPEQIRLDPTGPNGGVPAGAATVSVVEYYGHDVRYELELGNGTTIAARTHPGALFDRGDTVVARYEGSATEAWAVSIVDG